MLFLRTILRAIASEQRDGVEQSVPVSRNGQTQAAVLPEPAAQAVYPFLEFRVTEVVPIPRWKRLLDVGLILLALPVWLPLMLLLMAWTKIVSRGPVFYRQERVGHGARRFMLFKFRTMHVNAQTRTHEEYFAQLMQVDLPMTKLDATGDSRLIRCGRFLRASGLDELPQLFNVLRGDMSLVGPRPCLPNEYQRYGPADRERLNALPGLTGYWQVNGKNHTTFKEMIGMDIFYARNLSVWLDFKIMFKTVPALIAQMVETRRRSHRGDVEQTDHARATQRLDRVVKQA